MKQEHLGARDFPIEVTRFGRLEQLRLEMLRHASLNHLEPHTKHRQSCLGEMRWVKSMYVKPYMYYLQGMHCTLIAWMYLVLAKKALT